MIDHVYAASNVLHCPPKDATGWIRAWLPISRENYRFNAVWSERETTGIRDGTPICYIQTRLAIESDRAGRPSESSNAPLFPPPHIFNVTVQGSRSKYDDPECSGQLLLSVVASGRPDHRPGDASISSGTISTYSKFIIC